MILTAMKNKVSWAESTPVEVTVVELRHETWRPERWTLCLGGLMNKNNEITQHQEAEI